MESILVQLGFHRLQDFRVSVPAGIDTEASQAVNELGSVKIFKMVDGVGPFHESGVR
ncbi:hypothetical protein SDC9_208219 [bioreactor metagenome]|uniref:Uncharacterized protein n=1 Tax=bioreactor metagenome TaxID=1076179 RepID=A0A645JA51_9ZZZZ